MPPDFPDRPSAAVSGRNPNGSRKQAMPNNRYKTALVLSGGSARGLAHLGILLELEERGIQVDLIVGTSMGALIGGLYAIHGQASIVIERIRNLIESDLFSRAVSAVAEEEPEMGPDGFFHRFMGLFKKGVYFTHSMIRPALVSREVYRQLMTDLIPDHSIEDLSLPFAASTMDFRSGDEIVIARGSIRDAIAASAAIPGIMPPVALGERLLVDGGWADNVPVAPAIAMGAHFVIAVDTTLEVPGLGTPPLSALESLFRCNEMTRILLTRHRKARADVLITPEIGRLSWANFAAIDRCLAAGRSALAENIDTIRQRRRSRRWRTLSGLIHPARSGEWRHPFAFL